MGELEELAACRVLAINGDNGDGADELTEYMPYRCAIRKNKDGAATGKIAAGISTTSSGCHCYFPRPRQGKGRPARNLAEIRWTWQSAGTERANMADG